MTTSEQTSKTAIICNEDGPYIVKNVSRMISTQGQPIATKSSMALCRCGKSSNKPFCDGTHGKIGFSSELDPKRTRNKMKSHVGEKITVYDNRGLCAHAGVCTEKLASVFRLKQSPWIDPDQATVDEIRTVVDKCPSGALGYSTDGAQPDSTSGETTVKVIPNGPYHITGEVEMTGVEVFEGASEITRTLCRCGHSKNKPFCDGSHWSAGFQDA